ncbi:hypothetical protein G3545_07420 [Starkeya sp. ORNL1]|uniref:hypothetical protein n=1 Tax=Starkeya sp. ORNL1 TaxID=2709380 RepID=UPI00146423B4|nr:hypothetical protein [Starkeya sp. ORNL1]QJP13500.1 hypothetical protein G3545_07420 [Starkeya sp. ORNL1]
MVTRCNYCPALARPIEVPADAQGQIRVLETIGEASDYIEASASPADDPSVLDTVQTLLRAAQSGWPEDIAEATEQLERYLQAHRAA